MSAVSRLTARAFAKRVDRERAASAYLVFATRGSQNYEGEFFAPLLVAGGTAHGGGNEMDQSRKVQKFSRLEQFLPILEAAETFAQREKGSLLSLQKRSDAKKGSEKACRRRGSAERRTLRCLLTEERRSRQSAMPSTNKSIEVPGLTFPGKPSSCPSDERSTVTGYSCVAVG
jgi:hypothetical protein